MFNTFIFRHTQDTWERPIHESPNNGDSKTIMYSLTADFQGKIENELLLEKHRQNMEDRLPLVDDVGIYFTVYCRERYILPFVVKNVLDALIGPKLAYSDDSKVISVYTKHIIGGSGVIEIALFPETRFYPNSILSSKNAFIEFSVEAIPNDDIIQNPRTINHKLRQNPKNTAYISMISKDIKGQGVKLLNGNDLSVYIDIYTANSAGDIDNYALPYLLAMEGLVYPDIRNITYMYLNLYKNCRGRDYVKVEVYDNDN